ncbi:MAG: hypothetical protein L6R39_000307 [Caloplaca ligustica]|nr:MAG: hypothetical protein L6R39_000307 [Caloplaca ligustica]
MLLTCILTHTAQIARRLYDSYRGLSQYLDEEGVQQCPNSVALSPGGYCFFRAGGARAWNLPDRLDTLVDSALENGRENPLKNVWFGKDDSYVAQKQDGGLLWNLMGYYGNLESTLRYGTSGIKCLGLNLTDENSYIVLFMDGSFRLKAGETGLTSDDIKEWVRSWA